MSILHTATRWSPDTVRASNYSIHLNSSIEIGYNGTALVSSHVQGQVVKGGAVSDLLLDALTDHTAGALQGVPPSVVVQGLKAFQLVILFMYTSPGCELIQSERCGS